MKYLRAYNLFEKLIPWKEIPVKGAPYRKLKVESHPGKEGWYNCDFRCELGSGRAMIFTNKYFKRIVGKIEMKDNEAYIGGISTKPSGKGIGRQFISELFDYFKICRDLIHLIHHGLTDIHLVVIHITKIFFWINQMRMR